MTTRANLYLIGTFGREITQGSLLAQLAAVGQVDEYLVHVNSPGGSVPEGWAVHSTLAGLPGRKVCIVEGIAASIATVAALACDEVHIARGGSWMVHEPRWNEGGRAEELRANAEFLEKKNTEMVRLYCERTQMGEQEMRALLAKEKYLTAVEALAFGFVNSIDEKDAQFPAAAIASLDPGKMPSALAAALKGTAMDPEKLKEENEALKAQVAALSAKIEEMTKGGAAASEETPAKKDEEPAARAEDTPEKKDEEAEAKATATALAPQVAALVASAIREEIDRDKLLSERADLSSALVAQLKTLPLAKVKELVEAIPRTTSPALGAIAAARGAAAATQGAASGLSGPTAHSEPKVLAELDRQFGLAKPGPDVAHARGQTIISVVGTAPAEKASK